MEWNPSIGYRDKPCPCGSLMVDGFCSLCDSLEIQQRNEVWTGPKSKKRIISTTVAVVWTKSQDPMLSVPKAKIIPFGVEYSWNIIIGTALEIVGRRAQYFSVNGILPDVWLFLEDLGIVDEDRNLINHRDLLFPELNIFPTPKGKRIIFDTRKLIMGAREQAGELYRPGHKYFEIPEDVEDWNEKCKRQLLGIYYGSPRYRGLKWTFRLFGYLDKNLKLTEKGLLAVQYLIREYRPRFGEEEFIRLRERKVYWKLIRTSSKNRRNYWFLLCPTCSNGMSFEKITRRGCLTIKSKPPKKSKIECNNCATILIARFARRNENVTTNWL